MVVARPPHPHPDPAVGGWGDPAQVPVLSDAVLALLQDGLGVRDPAPAVSRETIELPRARLPGSTRQALEVILGPDHLRSDQATRLAHTRGRSTPDLLRLRAGDPAGAPDAVAFPGDHAQVLALLRACTEARVAVVPYGGGTSVVGGLEPEARDAYSGLLALDLRRFDGLLALDEESRLAVLQPGLRGPQAEALLGERGYTLGHFPQSFEYATLGGFAAARSSGQASAGYGRFDELVLALRAATPAGTLAAGVAPRSAAGPDLRQLLLGSEGTLGVITELTVQISRAPEQRVYEGWRFPSFWVGVGALRALAQDGPRPAVLRLSDEAETALNLSAPDQAGAQAPAPGAVAVVGYEGTGTDVAERRRGVARRLREHGGEPAEPAGEDWAEGRYRAPYLRDALLEAGAFVETLETAGFWSALPGLYESVSRALREALGAAGTPPIVLCHVSHVYSAGASLYFTVGCAQGEAPLSAWGAAKRAANQAILTAGGSITHHHGVGRDHREPYAREAGELGVRALQAVKRELDPAWILNPGILLALP